MGRWVIGLIAAGTFAAAPSPSPYAVLGPTVFHTASVRSSATKSFNVTCPAGDVAASAGISSAAVGVTPLSIRPTTLRGYAFRLGNAAGPAQRVTVAVACRKLAAAHGKRPAAVLRAVTVKTKAIVVRAQSQKSASLGCPAGTVPAGGGAVLGRGLELRRQLASLRSLSFTVRNTGSARRSAVFYGTCLTVLRPNGSPLVRLQVSLSTETTPVQSGSQVVKRSCPSGWVSLAAGYSLTSGVELDGAAAVQGGGRWTVRNRQNGQSLADLQLACGRVG